MAVAYPSDGCAVMAVAVCVCDSGHFIKNLFSCLAQDDNLSQTVLKRLPLFCLETGESRLIDWIAPGADIQLRASQADCPAAYRDLLSSALILLIFFHTLILAEAGDLLEDGFQRFGDHDPVVADLAGVLFDVD